MKQKISNIFKKYLTQKVRNIISIVVIVLGIAYIINYSFYQPSYINKYIATNIYKTAANSNFTDERFYACVIDSYNREKNTSLPYTTSLTTTQLSSLTELSCHDYDATSVDGLRFMTKLKDIHLNMKLSSLDFSSNSNLERLSLSSDYDLVSLNISNNSKLKYLSVANSDLPSLDLSANTNLGTVMLYNIGLNNINFGNNTNLNFVEMTENPLTTIDLSKNTGLEYLFLQNNSLTSINLNNNTALKSLLIGNYDNDNYEGSNSFTTFDLSKLTQLVFFGADNVGLEHINFDNNTELGDVSISHNNLSEQINFNNNTKLYYLDVSHNSLTKLNLSLCTDLVSLDASDNELTSINLLNNTELDAERLNLQNNNFHNVLTRYVHDNTGKANKAVTLPSTLNDSVTWKSDNDHIAEVVDASGKILTISEGEVDIVGTSPYYITKTHVYSFVASSDKYSISSDGGIIFVGSDTNLDTVKENISISPFIADEISIEVSSDNKSLKLIKNDTVLKTMTVVGVRIYNGQKTKFGSHYVYSATLSDPSDTFECINCTTAVDRGYLNIHFVHDDTTYTMQFKIVYLTTNYTVYGGALNEGGYIYVGNEENQQILNKFKVVNGTASINDGNIEIRYENDLLDSYKLKRISFVDDNNNDDNDSYIIGTNYIFTGFSTFDKDKIQVSDNLMTTSVNNSGELVVKNRTAQLAKYSILSLSSSTLTSDNTKIYINAGMTYNDFINSITKTGSITGKLYRGNTLVRSGELENGMVYKISYNNQEIKTYVIDATSYYVDLTNYKVKDNYIFLMGNNATINVSNINTRNCTLSLNQAQDKLEVLQDGDVVDSYSIVKITANFVFLKNYIYVGSITNADILKDITIPSGLKKEITSDDKLRITSGGNEIISIQLIRLKSEPPFIINDNNHSIFVINSQSQEEMNAKIYLNVDYGTAAVDYVEHVPVFRITFPEDNPVTLTYKLFGCSSTNEKYDLTKKYLYLGYSQNGEVNTSDFTGYNVNVAQLNNVLYLYQGDSLIATGGANDNWYFGYYILAYNFKDNSIKNVGDKIYTGCLTDYEIIDKLQFSNSNMSASIVDDKLVITYKAEKIDEIDLIRVTTTRICVKGVIFTGNTEFTYGPTNVINGFGEYDAENELFIVKAASEDVEPLETYKILGNVIFGNFLYRDKIILADPMLYSAFISNENVHSLNTHVTLKVYDGETQVTSGDVTAGMELVVYLDNVELCRFDITDEFITFASSLKKAENDTIIYRIPPGSRGISIYNLISTSGQISVYDSAGESIGFNNPLKTGDVFRIQLTNNTYDYKMCVMGDVLGTGELSEANAKKITEYIIKGNNFEISDEDKKYFELAADYNGNGQIKMNDVVKMVRAMNEDND